MHSLFPSMPNRYLEVAKRARERELHLERLASIELRTRRQQQPWQAQQPRAGSGPARPWNERPAMLANAAIAAKRPPCAKGAPVAGDPARARSAAPASARKPTDHAGREHQRHVAALMERLTKIERGDEWRQRDHAVRAQAAGRAQHTTAGTRQRTQRSLAQDNAVHMRRLRHTEARFATPAEIALLTGKPLPGAGGGGDAPTDDGDD